MKRFEVWLINLDPTVGREINKTRPCLVISPNEMAALSTVLVAPMTSQGFEFPSRINCVFAGKNGLVLLDQIRAVDKRRFVKKLGKLNVDTQKLVSDRLVEMFTF
ncbi:type II toxin-antitoxin system PemK/MazF family toxin [Hydrogenovibrio marinus]|nr:type II toxin-antitoxin system PemK/MazF family toxin [Hydrogenovibrio marinus]BBN60277.1 mRNA interferase [Hydrogenovibrio marinus]